MRTVCTPPILAMECDCAVDAPDGPTLLNFLIAGTELVNGMLNANYGACPVVLRPCGVNCRCAHHSWTPVPSSDGLHVLNVDCSSRRGPCGCDNRDRIDLGPWAAWRVTQVDVEGSVLPASDWWVENSRWLVRRDGTWPVCQDAAITNPADPGYFGVTLEWGPVEVPKLVELAISEATCRLLKNCLEKECNCEGSCVKDESKNDILMYQLKDVWPFTDLVNAHLHRRPVRFASRPGLVVR